MTAYKNTQYRLSIQFALDGFSFLIYNPEKLCVVAEKEVHYSAKDKFQYWLKIKLAGEEAFRQKYADVELLYAPEKYTLVPDALFEKEKQADLFSLSFPFSDSEMLQTEQLPSHTLLSAIPSEINRLLQDYFPTAKWKSTPFYLLQNIQNKKSWNIGILVLYKHLHVVITKENQLQLCTNFDFHTKDDLLYYMLYAFDNLSIPVAESSIQLWGNQNYLALLKQELSRYHNDIQLPARPDGLATKTPLGNLLLSNL